jgi:predicted enzyme related to lactoylglutathione lyase
LSLRDAPLLYVFYDIHGLDAQRETLESVLELPVIEIEPHLPHERHGVVKYDAGGTILSLNLSTAGKFRADESDALVTVLGADPGRDVEARLAGRGRLERHADGLLFSDPSGHHFLIEPADRPAVRELRLTVDDLDHSVAFYRDVLDLELLAADGGGARFRTGSVPLVLVEGDRAADGRRPQRRTVLIVFYTADVDTLVAAMRQRGLVFANRRAYFTDIGGSIRFEDPSGHRICLYQPSAECLTWGSGPKVLDLVTVP